MQAQIWSPSRGTTRDRTKLAVQYRYRSLTILVQTYEIFFLESGQNSFFN